MKPPVTKILSLFVLILIASFAEAQNKDRQVPTLCYHHIKKDTIGKSPDYTISVQQFGAHLEMLKDSGYTTITPDRLANASPLPERSIIISFDDSHAEHFTVAAPLLDKFGLKAVFFVTAVTIGKPGYMSAAQLKGLSDNGHIIGGHSWDHPDLRKISVGDRDLQLSKSLQTLAQITGKPVTYFAYPFGTWNNTVIEELKKHGIKAAFQLSSRQDKNEPLFTIRRLMVSGKWSANTLYKKINIMF